MDTEFEKGKKKLIDGLTGFMGLYKPYLLMNEGMRLLGITDVREGHVDDKDPLISADIWDLALNNFVADLNRAKNRDEIAQAVENHREFIKRLF